MPQFPSGTVTFLFTDVEGSTQRWEADSPAMLAAVERHFALLDEAIAANHGVRYKVVGDAVQAAFPSAIDGLLAAIAAQQAIVAEDWGVLGPLLVRMALHTGAATPRDGDYLAPSLNRLARLLSAAAGGQMLVSETTRDLLRDVLPAGVALRDLGQHRLRDLREPEHVFQIESDGLPAEFPPLRSLTNRAGNLPAELTSFVGRERELLEVERLLAEQRVRLLTLTGAGGTGKSRLALHAALSIGPHFPDGAWLVSLASVSDVTLIARRIADALALREIPGEPAEQTLRTHLLGKRSLIVLDDFEHLLDGAPLVGDLLARCPDVQILVTSRAPLRIAGEHELAVAPLAIPEESAGTMLEAALASDAVHLFVDRVRAVRQDFALTEANAATVAAICRELDGLPLAIELAAARARLLSPEAMLARLGSRLTLLTGGGRDRPERHQTLRSAIAWSHDLLQPDEQIVFRRCAAFAGGFALEATEALSNRVSPAVPAFDALAALHENSLVREVDQAVPAASAEPRFAMLRTVREFASEMLDASGERDVIHETHAEIFLGLALEAEPNLTGPAAIDWLDRLEIDLDNLRAAFDWFRERNDATHAVRHAAALWRFWWLRGRINEGRTRTESALAIGVATSDNSTLATALDGAGVLAETQGDYGRAESLHRQALALSRNLDDRKGISRALNNLGVLAFDRGEFDQAEALSQESLLLARNVGDPDLIATALTDLGRVSYDRGDLQQAEARYRESLALRRQTGNVTETARSLNNLGFVAQDLADFSLARRLFEESLALYRQTGDTWGAAAPLFGLAVSLHHDGEDARAIGLLEESLAIFQETGDRRNAAIALQRLATAARESGDGGAALEYYRDALERYQSLDDRVGIVEVIIGIAGLRVDEGRHDEAARLLGVGAAAAEADDPDQGRVPSERFGVDALMARSALGDAAFEAAFDAGRRLPIADAVAEALG